MGRRGGLCLPLGRTGARGHTATLLGPEVTTGSLGRGSGQGSENLAELHRRKPSEPQAEGRKQASATALSVIREARKLLDCCAVPSKPMAPEAEENIGLGSRPQLGASRRLVPRMWLAGSPRERTERRPNNGMQRTALCAAADAGR